MQKIDEDKLFNLFSMYGNIVRIKILKNKPDHALIQMADGLQAELAVLYLKVLLGHTFFYSGHCLLCVCVCVWMLLRITLCSDGISYPGSNAIRKEA